MSSKARSAENSVGCASRPTAVGGTNGATAKAAAPVSATNPAVTAHRLEPTEFVISVPEFGDPIPRLSPRRRLL